jgi:hypothetical protein
MRRAAFAAVLTLLASGCLGGATSSHPDVRARVQAEIEHRWAPAPSSGDIAHPARVVCKLSPHRDVAECVGRFPELLHTGAVVSELVPMSFHLRNGRIASPDCTVTHGLWGNPFCSIHGAAV